MFHTLIETPNPYESMQVWRDFLKEVEAMDQSDLGVRAAVQEAKRVIDLHERQDRGEKIRGPWL